MKKNKILFVLILGLFMFVGVKMADAAPTVNNFQLVCEPSELEKGDQGKCYLIAKVTPDQTTKGGLHGVIARTTVSHLKIKDTVAGNGNKDIFTTGVAKNGQKFDAPAAAYTCNSVAGETCYGFFTKNPASVGQIKPDVTGLPSGIDSRYTGFATIGYYNVELSETATERECGKICVTVDFAATGSDYASLTTGQATQICAEIKPKTSITVTPEEPNPETGSFASIAVLIAGALIAIGAIAVAKKNNKFYRV